MEQVRYRPPGRQPDGERVGRVPVSNIPAFLRRRRGVGQRTGRDAAELGRSRIAKRRVFTSSGIPAEGREGRSGVYRRDELLSCQPSAFSGQLDLWAETGWLIAER